MSQQKPGYFASLIDGVGVAWNRFWYTPTDPLPLGIMRIGAGAIALYLHATLSPDLVAFFGKGGLLDKVEVSSMRPAYTQWFCFLDYLQSPSELWLGHLIAGVILVLFTIGFYSRITSVLSLYVVLCYMHRGPMITAQAEVILSMMLLYLCLGPCGRCLSVDAWRARRGKVQVESMSSWGANVALRLLQVHVSLIYLMMAAAKLKGGDFGPVWWSGDAMWFLIARPESRLVDLTFLHAYPFVVNLWTHAVVAFELAFGLMIWNRLWRPLLLGVSLLMWGSLALVTGLIPFCLLMTLAGVAFVPGATLRGYFGRSTTSPMSSADTSTPESQRRVTVALRQS